MKLEQVTLPVNNPLLSDYWAGSEKLRPFYQYRYNDESFKNRATYINNKTYNSEGLSNIIRSYMEPFGISNQVESNIKLLENGALAVVGGQQSGLLTGPLYSVHKAISVIKLAREQSEKLGIHVVPIFWIAGEDHDIEEINHTYTIVDGEVKKRAYKERSNKKTMASETNIVKEQMKKLIENIFKDFGETKHTKKLYENVCYEIEQSTTFTQFFTSLMNSLFKEEGLLMIDAAYLPFRQYEASFFSNMIEANEQIANAVVEKESLFEKVGYGKPIDASIENANLFYVSDGERFLLERKDKYFVNANANIKLTKEQLLQIAENHPEQLSNNVVTRPLMQEMTIPVLAFVGGPGELAYWATLKDAFKILDLEMPILAPRLNITIISRQVDQLLNDYRLTVDDVVKGKAEELKNQFIESVQDEEAKQQITELNQLIDERYNTLLEHLTSQQLTLNKIVEKNKQYHKNQFDYLSHKIEQEVLIKHEKIIRQFNVIMAEIYPNENYQERVFNPYQFINIYGTTFVKDLLNLPMSITNTHYIVKM